MSESGRTIAIWHRRKATVDGEARPTLLIIDGSKPQALSLATEADELDFVLNRFPLTYRPAMPEDSLEGIQLRHCKIRKAKKTDDLSQVPPQLIVEKGSLVVTHLPLTFGGLQAGDTVVMLLGGSGDRLAYAISNPKLEICVRRISPAIFAERRQKEDDLNALLLLFYMDGTLFRQIFQNDREQIRLKEALSARQEAMKARIACGTRLEQSIVGRIFIAEPEGLYAAGSIEAMYEAERANDTVFQSLLSEEKRREVELKKMVNSLKAYNELFKPIDGCGELIAARLIASIGNIKLFPSEAKLKAYCGVHVLADGSLPRKKRGIVANWKPDARQALFLLGDQFNRRPGSYWGGKLLENKVRLRAVHPAETGHYSDGHILKMAKWRTLTQFVVWLYREWNRLEDENRL